MQSGGCFFWGFNVVGKSLSLTRDLEFLLVFRRWCEALMFMPANQGLKDGKFFKRYHILFFQNMKFHLLSCPGRLKVAVDCH